MGLCVNAPGVLVFALAHLITSSQPKPSKAPAFLYGNMQQFKFRVIIQNIGKIFFYKPECENEMFPGSFKQVASRNTPLRRKSEHSPQSVEEPTWF